MKGIENSFEKVGTAGHEGVLDPTKVCAFTHFFCENVGGIAISIDVCDRDDTFLDPLTSGIILILDMTITLCG